MGDELCAFDACDAVAEYELLALDGGDPTHVAFVCKAHIGDLLTDCETHQVDTIREAEEVEPE